RSAGRAPEPVAERLEERIVRLLSPEALHALPAGRPQLRTGRALLVEGVEERRLPDARLAGDEHHLPLALEGLVEAPDQPGEIGLAAHDPPTGGGTPIG